MDRDDAEKRIADLEHQVAAPRTAPEARGDEKRARREARQRVEDDAGVSRAQMGRTKLVAGRTLVVLGVLGIAVFIVGLVFRHTTSWIWIGGLALFGASVLPIFAMAVDEMRKIEKVRWQEGTVTFRTVEPGNRTEDGWYVDCEVELNPTGRITRVYGCIGYLGRKRLVVGATMRCLIDRTEAVALRAFPWAEPDAPLPSGDDLLFFEGKSRKFPINLRSEPS